MLNPSEKVLLYQIKGTEIAVKLQPVILQMGLRIKSVMPEEYGQPLGVLAGIKGFQAERRERTAGEESQDTATGAESGEQAQCLKQAGQAIPSAIPEPMLVMCGMGGNRVDEFLARMRRVGVPKIALKAMLTPTNVNWTSRELYEELRREHEAMSK